MKKRAVTKPRTLPLITEDALNERILTTKELMQRIPLRRQTIWRMVREGRFPQPIRLTESRLGWRWSVILGWLSEREQKPLGRRAYFGNDNTKSA